MLVTLTSPTISRRQLLQIGGVGALSLTLGLDDSTCPASTNTCSHWGRHD